jgi:creatinine amidohydrolase/Fe(II)-dependent formamide hydrolase-like protein
MIGRVPISDKTKPSNNRGTGRFYNVKDDSLKELEVIRRLEVGPVRLDRRRITAPYRVIGNDTDNTIDLAYRFEEDVFIPDEHASINLGNMISAQVALNYGLFCEEIVFRGQFDTHDRRFIGEMAKNTAREIFVKKFLEPNPFLTGTVTELPPMKLNTYLRAKISFPDTYSGVESESLKKGGRTDSWHAENSRHAVLSSGGKDSLLSFSLLKEIGCEVHPIFINESGRHWFTALNAYRHFHENERNTARVWTNADRVFSWMLRHLPFVRKDFERLRSDEYPIRLWTVAVFLFGALPLLQKRGINRMIIGNEFDTTRRVTHKSITHYDGLYDQSRYFDDVLTRYFLRKRWGVNQFSILRSLSELLIEKILIVRYPEIQSLQVSCHAAHKEGDRVHPCGRCEKCRRIVGMLLALGGAPEHCGYSHEQVEYCLRSLSAKGSHQETEDAQHLAYMLTEKGFINAPSLGPVRARKRHEIVKLRCDPERSPLEAIPLDLREPLYRIYMEHADGAVKKRGRVWIDFNPLIDPAMNRPYTFESSRSLSDVESLSDHDVSKSKATYLLGELTWPEAGKRIKEVDVALLPVGSIEQHGLHLPLDTDAFDADYLARKVAGACRVPKPLVLPLIPYGVSYHHDDFSGTISISPDTLSRMVYEIGMSAARHGILKLVIINGHGGNSPALHFAAQMINRDAHIFTCVDTGESSDTDINSMVETPNDVHAGEIETSTSLAVRPDLVKLESARRYIPHFSSRYLNFSSKRGVGWYAYTSRLSATGVLGDPTKATPEKGKQIWDLMIKNLVEFVEDLKGMSLEELYHRRY